MNWPNAKKIVICLYLLMQFCKSSPQHNQRNGNDIAVHKNKNSVAGCLHNNTMFADTSIVPSSEPCLICKCSKRNLVCVRRVCKDQPYPPPRGCILVYKKSLCCPYLSCSKYHVNYYKNAERNGEHINNDYHQITHEKISEKNYRTDDTEEMNGGCIESGSLYASGSAMYRSSASLCSYCYCINGQQKCIKPKCMLKNTKCKPIYMEASCCPIKYDCSGNNSNNSSAIVPSRSNDDGGSSKHADKLALVKRKNRSNGCFENGKFYQEGERLPLDEQRPCEVCYCIKGMRKCTVKKCAPVIRGCVPKMPAAIGSCCPSSYDCRRSMKYKRESRQENEDEGDEDNDSIDIFSLLFGSDDPKENEEEVKESTMTMTIVNTTEPPPFKALPSTTESSFFDLIRAGLEIIDANADKIDSHLNTIVSTTTLSPSSSQSSQSEMITSSSSPLMRNKQSTTEKVQPLTSNEKTTKTFTTSTTTSSPMTSTTKNPESSSIKSTKVTASRTTTAKPTTVTSSSITASTPSVKVTLPPKMTTTRKVQMTSSSKRPSSKQTTITTTTTTAATTKSTSTMRTTTSKKYIVPSTLQNHEHPRLPAPFNANVLPDNTKLIVSDENEADTLPNLEIIPFVAHDAIKTDKYETYRQPPSYDNLEKDYYGNDNKEKPFRYNNKFIHHNYDDSLDYVHTNPHSNDRIDDNGPYYYESNENQFESFSPPNEQDFLGGFSPKESIYDEVSTSANYELPLKHNDYAQKPLDTSTMHEHKSYLTSTEKASSDAVVVEAATLAINQTNDVKQNQQKQQQQHEEASSTVPNFKKISSNFTSFIDDLLQANALDNDTKLPLISSTASPSPPSTTTTTMLLTSKVTTTSTLPSTSAPIKSIINDDDFIIKHLKASSSSSSSSPSTSTSTSKSTSVKSATAAATGGGLMEIFSKPTNPTMNGLLKLAGCNIYGQMYEVGHVIEELSNPCLECKCLPDIGVGCVPLKC